MRKSLIIVGFILFIVGVVLGFYAFSEELLNRLHYEGLHEFLDSYGDSRRAYSVSWHHYCIDWASQENVDLAKNVFLPPITF